MIYITTFILALFLIQNVCTRPQTCGTAISPELLIQGEQQTLPITPQPICDNKYDNPAGLLSDTACSNMAVHYKYFKNNLVPTVGALNDGDCLGLVPGGGSDVTCVAGSRCGDVHPRAESGERAGGRVNCTDNVLVGLKMDSL